MRKTLLFLLFCLSFQWSFGQEKSALLVKALQQLSLKEKDINMNLFVEKVLPNDNAKSVLVLPKYSTKEQDEYGHDFLIMDAYVLVVDNQSGKILYRNIEKDAWTSDAIEIQSLTIDTGLYILGQGKRAFGIRVSSSNSSRLNPYSIEDLNLFIVEENKLNKVANNITIYSYGGEAGLDCAGDMNSESTIITIDDKHQTNGFNNLRLKTTETNTVSKLVKGDCQTKETKKQTVTILKYNGKEYK